MEKFGIFELLDTLSAFAAPDPETKAEETKPQPTDGAFAPPPYAAADAGATEKKSDSAALASLLDRHNRIAKKIDGKK